MTENTHCTQPSSPMEPARKQVDIDRLRFELRAAVERSGFRVTEIDLQYAREGSNMPRASVHLKLIGFEDPRTGRL